MTDFLRNGGLQNRVGNKIVTENPMAVEPATAEK